MAIRGGTPQGSATFDDVAQDFVRPEAEPGAEVSCRILTFFLMELERAQLPARLICRGTEETAETLSRFSHRISWTTFRQIMTNVGHVWSEEQLEEMGASVRPQQQALSLKLASRIFLTPRGFYGFIANVRGDRLIRCFDIDSRTPSDKEIELEFTMHEGYEPSRELFVWIKGVLRGLPLVVGARESVVKMEMLEGGVRYRVLLPKVGNLFTWSKDLLAWPVRTLGLIQELRHATVEMDARHRDLWEREEKLERVKRALSESENRFRQLFNAAPVSMIITSAASGEILEANRSFVHLTGYGRSDVLGHTLREVELWSVDDERRAVEGLGREQGFQRAFEVQLGARSGERLTGLLSVQSVQLGGEQCLIWQTLDVTSRREMENELREHRQERIAERAHMLEGPGELPRDHEFAAMENLASGIANQLAEPLNAILSSAEFALVCRDDPSVLQIWEQALRESVSEAHRGSRLLRSLLQFARGEPAERWAEDVGELVSRCCKRVDPEAVERQVRIQLSTSSEPLLVVHSPIELEQALANVLRNAVGASEPDTAVEVSVAQSGDRVRIEVSDSGGAVEEQNLPRVFEPFFVARPSASAGLGLSIARGIVVGHDGHATAEHRSEGLVIVVELPCAVISDP